MTALLYVCLLCVPVMLCAKPCYIHRMHRGRKRKLKKESGLSKRRSDLEATTSGSETEDLVAETPARLLRLPTKRPKHQLQEIVVHQLIETIEFVLGTVSNTASYLRLWALSLAHSQLAKVFFDQTLGAALTANSVVMLVLSFPVFLGASLFVLMFMDVMECFLHDLRLHWVEFQNKFFKGTGTRWEPHSHANLLNVH